MVDFHGFFWRARNRQVSWQGLQKTARLNQRREISHVPKLLWPPQGSKENQLRWFPTSDLKLRSLEKWIRNKLGGPAVFHHFMGGPTVSHHFPSVSDHGFANTHCWLSGKSSQTGSLTPPAASGTIAVEGLIVFLCWAAKIWTLSLSTGAADWWVLSKSAICINDHKWLHMHNDVYNEYNIIHKQRKGIFRRIVSLEHIFRSCSCPKNHLVENMT